MGSHALMGQGVADTQVPTQRRSV